MRYLVSWSGPNIRAQLQGLPSASSVTVSVPANAPTTNAPTTNTTAVNAVLVRVFDSESSQFSGDNVSKCFMYISNCYTEC